MSDRIDLGGAAWDAIPRAILRDARLSPKAKGGLVTLLSHDEGWVRSSLAILQRENDCGREQAKAIMRELREAGYAELVKERNLDGRVTTHYIVRTESTSSPAESSGFPGDGKPAPQVQPPEGAGLRSPGFRSPVNRAAVVDPQDVDPQEPTTTPPSRRRVEKIGKPRKADPVFDALAELHGGTPSLTRQAAATIGTAAAGIRAAMPDVTAEEIEQRANAYRLLSWNHDRAFPSATALAKWWGDCATVEPAARGLGAELLIEEQMREGSSG